VVVPHDGGVTISSSDAASVVRATPSGPAAVKDLYLDKAQPGIWKAYNQVAAQVRDAAAEAGLPRSVMELINVRVSQINGCAFCLDLHTRLAAAVGVSAQKLSLLPAWRETSLFSEQEQAALRIAEVITDLPRAEEREATIVDARRSVGDGPASVMLWAAVTINAFNRVSIASRHPVRARREASAGASGG